jgi:hypothetical protein
LWHEFRHSSLKIFHFLWPASLLPQAVDRTEQLSRPLEVVLQRGKVVRTSMDLPLDEALVGMLRDQVPTLWVL